MSDSFCIFDLHPEWRLGRDGLPVHPAGDPRCSVCNGHGVVEDGNFHYASVLIDCPLCISKMTHGQMDASGHSGLLHLAETP